MNTAVIFCLLAFVIASPSVDATEKYCRLKWKCHNVLVHKCNWRLENVCKTHCKGAHGKFAHHLAGRLGLGGALGGVSLHGGVENVHVGAVGGLGLGRKVIARGGNGFGKFGHHGLGKLGHLGHAGHLGKLGQHGVAHHAHNLGKGIYYDPGYYGYPVGNHWGKDSHYGSHYGHIGKWSYYDPSYAKKKHAVCVRRCHKEPRKSCWDAKELKCKRAGGKICYPY